MKQHTYIAIDLKSFYASVECRERGLDPLNTNLVVADESRTDKTICLAVTPSLKSYGISGRGRLFEVKQRVKEANAGRQHGAVEKDPYGREIPKQAHGSINLDGHTSSTRKIMRAVSELFDRIVDKNLLVRRMYVVANHVLPEADVPKKNDGAVQLDLFTDYAAEEEKQKAENAALERERKIQAATLAIKKKYGKNAILKAMNLEEGATAKDRNAQIGGHKAQRIKQIGIVQVLIFGYVNVTYTRKMRFAACG